VNDGKRPLAFAGVFGGLLLSCAATATTLTVCATGQPREACEYAGSRGIQSAVDRAIDGDTVLLRAGTYSPEAFTDVPYKKYVIRAYVAIRDKRITVVGEPGAVLDGSSGPPVSAIVVEGGHVTLQGLTLRNLRAGDSEDDLYEGHGVFVIDAAATLAEITIEKYAKMALTGRGTTRLLASQVRIQDGHVAIWLEESAHLRLCNSVVRNNDSAGIAAYGSSSANVYNSVFDRNRDDGLYAENDASIFATNSLLLHNSPYAVRVIGNARAQVGYSILFGNAAKSSQPNGKQSIRWGKPLIERDPQTSVDYALPQPLPGDPDVRGPRRLASTIGLSGVAACL
jgi:parallel beta-helix repeat protein